MSEALQLLSITPLLILALGSLILLMYGAFTNDARGTAWLSALLFITAAVPWLVASPMPSGTVRAVFPTEGGALLLLTPYSMLASQLILLMAALFTPLARGYLQLRKAFKPEFYVLTVLSVTGMLVLVNSNDFLSFYMGLELMSFAVYIMVAFLRNDARSSEAGLKYFVLGGLASGLFLYGISLLYAATGATGFPALHATLATAGLAGQPVVLIGLALILTGTLFKLSAVPLHMWTPDVYQGAPTPVTAFMSILPKLTAGIVLVRLLTLPFASLAEAWQPLLAVMALLSMALGSVLAILQTSVKRLLAWSTVANVGFILVGMVALAGASSAQGASAVMVYLVVYALTTLTVFAALLASGAERTEDLKGLGHTSPATAVALTVGLFSLAGIPPLAGFMGKLGVFTAAVAAGYTWLAVAGVLCSAIACFYSLYLIKLIAFDAPATVADTTIIDLDTPASTTGAMPHAATGILQPAPMPKSAQDALLTLALTLSGVLLLLGIFPSLLTTLTQAASAARLF